MTRRRSEQCLSDLKLDRWLSAELTPPEQRSAEAHLMACDSCRSRRAELLEARSGFPREAPPFAALGRFEQGASRPAASTARRPSRRLAPVVRWLAGGGALAAAAALAFAIGEPWRASQSSAGAGTRTKGGLASLGWVVRRGERVFTGRPDQPLRAGDAVRFTISAREPVFVAILGLDARGTSVVYYPDGEQLSKVEAGRDQLLPAAIELDARPDEEQVYGIFCSSPVPVAPVREAIERSASVPALPEGCSSERVSLPREPP